MVSEIDGCAKFQPTKVDDNSEIVIPIHTSKHSAPSLCLSLSLRHSKLKNDSPYHQTWVSGHSTTPPVFSGSASTYAAQSHPSAASTFSLSPPPDTFSFSLAKNAAKVTQSEKPSSAAKRAAGEHVAATC